MNLIYDEDIDIDDGDETDIIQNNEDNSNIIDLDFEDNKNDEEDNFSEKREIGNNKLGINKKNK